MNRRLELHELLVEILGSRNVYFQPPVNVRMKYPAIVYSRNDVDNQHADNLPYIQKIGYQIIVVDKDPDSEIVGKVAQLPLCRYDRHYNSDNLNHDVFSIYY